MSSCKHTGGHFYPNKNGDRNAYEMFWNQKPLDYALYAAHYFSLICANHLPYLLIGSMELVLSS